MTPPLVSAGACADSVPCGRVDPDIFFPPAYSRSNRRAIDFAKALCHGCQARSRCLESALLTGEEHGIWGGMTPEERARVAARRLRNAS